MNSTRRRRHVFEIVVHVEFVSVFRCAGLVSLCLLQPQLCALGWQKWSSMWSPAAVAHSPHGSRCCAIRDAFLLTTIEQNGYLSLSVSLNHSPLTPLINLVFLSKETMLAGCFFLVAPFWVNSRDGCVWKSREIKSDQNIRSSSSGNNRASVRITKIAFFFLHSDGWCEHYPKLLTCTCVISWLALR